jgi:hypothetical protein
MARRPRVPDDHPTEPGNEPFVAEKLGFNSFAG